MAFVFFEDIDSQSQKIDIRKIVSIGSIMKKSVLFDEMLNHVIHKIILVYIHMPNLFSNILSHLQINPAGSSEHPQSSSACNH